jgi:transcriptional regulator with XRE-family HTH domain
MLIKNQTLPEKSASPLADERTIERYAKFETTIVGWPVVLIDSVIKSSSGPQIPNPSALEAAVLRHRIQQSIRFRPKEILWTRKILGLKAQDLAKRLDIRPDYLSKLENGHHPMTAQTERQLRLLVALDKQLERLAPLIQVDAQAVSQLELTPFENGKIKIAKFQLMTIVQKDSDNSAEPEQVYQRKTG